MGVSPMSLTGVSPVPKCQKIPDTAKMAVLLTGETTVPLALRESPKKTKHGRGLMTINTIQTGPPGRRARRGQKKRRTQAESLCHT
jgi:hypothetical protein